MKRVSDEFPGNREKMSLHPFCWSHRLVRIFQTTEAQIEEEDTEVNGFGFRLFLERRTRHAPEIPSVASVSSVPPW